MPLCKCGVKVDRGRGDVQCIVCKQFFHAKCCNINNNDIVFIKDFKCESCLKLRRQSLSGAPGVVANVPVITDAAAKDVVTALTADYLSRESSSSVSKVDELLCVLNNNNVESSNEQSNVSFDLLLSEVRSLKSSQAELLSLVTSLCSSNASLINKVEALETTVSNLKAQISHANESSPKRKKNSALSLNLSPAPVNAPMSLPISSNSAAADVGTKNPGFSFANILRSSADFPALSATPSTMRWDVISKKKKKKNTPIVVGASENTDLGVFVKKKWLHISSFKSSVKAEEIIDYVSKNANIGKTELTCYALNKKDAVLTDLKFLNFKLGVSENCYDKVFSPSLWPSNIKVRPFLLKPKESEVSKDAPPAAVAPVAN